MRKKHFGLCAGSRNDAMYSRQRPIVPEIAGRRLLSLLIRGSNTRVGSMVISVADLS